MRIDEIGIFYLRRPPQGLRRGGVLDRSVAQRDVEVEAPALDLLEVHVAAAQVHIVVQAEMVERAANVGLGHELLSVDLGAVERDALYADALLEDVAQAQVHRGLPRSHHRVAIGVHGREAVELEVGPGAQAQALHLDVHARLLRGIARETAHGEILHRRKVQGGHGSHGSHYRRGHRCSNPFQQTSHYTNLLFIDLQFTLDNI